MPNGNTKSILAALGVILTAGAMLVGAGIAFGRLQTAVESLEHSVELRHDTLARDVAELVAIHETGQNETILICQRISVLETRMDSLVDEVRRALP